MTKIICKLFGPPKIIKEGALVHFPYAKINALLYYMLIAKVASRDEVSGLLWPNEPDDVAKRNLRNAMYQAKKSLGLNIILSPLKSTLILNETLDIQIDVDQFLAAPQDGLELYTGEFLQGFFLKGSENYEYWVVKMRNAYREKFSLECYTKIEDDLKNKRYSQAETYIHQLVAQDEYDERNRQLLIRFYQETGQDGKAIETYYELSELLREELGITPDQNTRKLYEQSLERICLSSEKPRADDIYLCNRNLELAMLEKMLRDFEKRGQGCKSMLVTGEPGSGKTAILHKILGGDSRPLFVFAVQGQLAEQTLPLRPCRELLYQVLRLFWEEQLIMPGLYREIMSGLFPDFQDNPPAPVFFSQTPVPTPVLVQFLVEAFRTLAAKRPVLLVVENLQWMDADSLRLLTAVMLECGPPDVMLLATHNLEHSPELDYAVAGLKSSRKFMVVSLERLSVEACHQLIKNALPGRKVSGELLERVYNETRGNPFFLSAAIENMKEGKPSDQISPAVEEFLQRRFLYLPQNALDVAELFSLLYEGCRFDDLRQLMEDCGENDLLSALDILERRGILQELNDEVGAIISFTHPRLGAYLSGKLSQTKRQYLHRKIGCLLENRLSAGPATNKLCSLLVYHFSHAGDHLKEIKYELSILNRQLNFSHEVFPILDGEILELDFPPYLSRMRLNEMFQDIEARIQEIRRSMRGSGELDMLELQFLYLRGRCSILSGAYDTGINDIMYMIRKSKQINAIDYTGAGYKQLIVYYIQTDNPPQMEQYVKMALNLMLQSNNHKEIGIMLRMKGLYYMMIGKYQQAEALLMQSVDMFSISDEAAKSYAINIAAAYDYIGEIRLAEKNYPDALQLFHEAISLCTSQALSSLSYFSLNAGKAAYFSGDSSAARDYFEQSGKLYQRFDFIWRRPTLDAYLGLLLWEEGDVRSSLEHLEAAQQRMWSMEDPRDSGAVYFAKALIRQMADQTPGPSVESLLPKPAAYYCQRARELLNPHLDQYELERLEKIFGKAGQ